MVMQKVHHWCSYILFESKDELLTTDEIIKEHHGVCPFCHKTLSYFQKPEKNRLIEKMK